MHFPGIDVDVDTSESRIGRCSRHKLDISGDRYDKSGSFINQNVADGKLPAGRSALKVRVVRQAKMRFYHAGTQLFGGRIGLKSGVTDGIGLNNIGLLVTVYGRVTAPPAWTYFYLDDGSTNFDGSGFTGLKIMCGDLTKPSEGAYVRVTGISSIQRPEGTSISIPVIRVRDQGDIEVVN